jgi:hypothetical protein
MSTKSQAIATIDPGSGSIAAQLITAVRANQKVQLLDVYDPGAGLDRLANAGADELFAPEDDQGALKVKDILGQPFRFDGAEFRNSTVETSEGSLGIYAVIFATVKGRAEVITCGATQVVVFVARALETDAIGKWAVFTSDTTKKGNTVYKMVGAVPPVTDESGEEF